MPSAVVLCLDCHVGRKKRDRIVQRARHCYAASPLGWQQPTPSRDAENGFLTSMLIRSVLEASFDFVQPTAVLLRRTH